MSLSREHCGNGLLVITLDEPDRRNPIGHAVRLELLRALCEAEEDPRVRGVVLTGAGGHFSAGGDLRDQRERDVAEHRARFATIRDLILRMVRYSKPLAAAVEGWAAGGGMALALACPTVVGSREARFVSSFVRIGLIPDMGLLATLPARIGPALARRFVLNSEIVDAPAAERLGFVDELCDPGQAARVAGERVLAQADVPPLPRQFIIDWFARDVAEALEYEQSIQPILLNSADAVEGRAAFLEKRPARFQGR